eukprot:11750_1
MDLQTFLLAPNKKSFRSNRFKISGLEFICTIYPNGINQGNPGQVLFYLEFLSAPETVSRFSFICKIYCPQTGNVFQTTETFQIKKGKRNNVLFAKWPDASLKLSDCKNKNELEFICHCEILHIDNQNIKQGLGFERNKLLTSEWIVSDDMLRQLHSYYIVTNAPDTLKFVNYFGTNWTMGPNIGKHFLIYFVGPILQYPQSTSCEYPYDEYAIRIELCQFPVDIDFLEINCTLNIHCNFSVDKGQTIYKVKKTEQINNQRLFPMYNYNCSKSIIIPITWPCHFRCLSHLRFKVELKILRFKSKNDAYGV